MSAIDIIRLFAEAREEHDEAVINGGITYGVAREVMVRFEQLWTEVAWLRSERSELRRTAGVDAGDIAKLMRERDQLSSTLDIVARREEKKSAEIARLRAENERLTRESNSWHNIADDLSGMEFAQRAEIARLRAENDELAACGKRAAKMGIDEVARLRAQNEHLTGDAARGHVACGKLAEENARLRGLLEGALVPCPDGHVAHNGPYGVHACETCHGTWYVPVEADHE